MHTYFNILHEAFLQYRSWRDVSISSSLSTEHHLGDAGNCFPENKEEKEIELHHAIAYK